LSKKFIFYVHGNDKTMQENMPQFFSFATAPTGSVKSVEWMQVTWLEMVDSCLLRTDLHRDTWMSWIQRQFRPHDVMRYFHPHWFAWNVSSS
jgi:hypothetical protein